MSAEASESEDNSESIFDHKEFWYKIDVDWDEVKEEFTSAEEEDDEDTEDKPDTFSEALLIEFSKGKKGVIERDYDTVRSFTADLQSKKSTEAKSELMRLYVEYQWSLKQKEDEFTSSDIEDILSRLSNDGPVVRNRINNEYDILWPGNSEIDKEVEKGEVTARKLLKTNPVIVKKQDDEFVIRGKAQSRGRVTERLYSYDNVDKSEPDQREESISGQMGSMLSQTSGKFRDSFKIIDVKYTESALPGHSGIILKNESGIHRDIKELQSNGYLKGMAGLEEFRVKDLVHGGRFRITLTHRQDGFKFDSLTTHKTDEERQKFERRFSKVAEVEFDTIYEYGAEDDRYLLNRILSGSYKAYDSFYSKLSSDQQDFIDEVLERDEDDNLKLKKKKDCEECGEPQDVENDVCEHCEETRFGEPYPVETKVNPNSVCSYYNRVIRDVSPSHSDVNFLKFDTQTTELRDNRVVEANVKMHRSPGSADHIRQRQVYFAPLGNGQKVRRFSDYLLEAVYVTYGPKDGEDFSGYGSLSLYDLLFNENVDNAEIVGEATYNAVHSLEERVLAESRDALETAKKYLATVDGIDEIHENEDILSEYYGSGTFFEKQVFYLIRFLFERSERWGKENKRESDGAIIFPREDADKYHILSYDSKLSFAEDGYDFSPAEEDQATRYILHDNDWESLKVKTGDRHLDAHIMISQNFNDNHFSKMAENVHSHFDVFSSRDVDTHIVYLKFESLVSLYEIKRRLYEHMSDGELVKKFNQFFLEEVHDQEEDSPYTLITKSDVENIDEKMTDWASEYDDDRLRPYSEEGRDE